MRRGMGWLVVLVSAACLAGSSHAEECSFKANGYFTHTELVSHESGRFLLKFVVEPIGWLTTGVEVQHRLCEQGAPACRERVAIALAALMQGRTLVATYPTGYNCSEDFGGAAAAAARAPIQLTFSGD